jgi:rod shape-determining protein MreD
MRRNIAWVVVTVVAALMESTLLKGISIQEVLPDLPLLLVAYFAFQEGEERAMFTGVIGGLIQDVASNASLGHNVLALVVVGYIAGRLSKRLLTEHPAVKVALVFGASLTEGILFVTIQYVQNPNFGATYMILTSAVPTAFYTTLVTPFVFFALDRGFRRDVRLEGSPA